MTTSKETEEKTLCELHKCPTATGDCNHVIISDNQVTMRRQDWENLIEGTAPGVCPKCDLAHPWACVECGEGL